MIKFILHGGNSSRKGENNEKFFLEVINSFDSNSINILCVYFARPEHRWEESFIEDKEMFLSAQSQKELNLEMAKLEKEILIDQIKNSDIIFINGGRRGCLKKTLIDLGNFRDIIKNKVVVGISAGANILSKYYYSSVAEDIREGIGLLPIKIFCHFTEENIDDFEKLDNYKEKLPVYKIPEGKFIVIEM